MSEDHKRLRDGGLKTLVMTASVVLLAGAAEAARAGRIREAAVMGVLAVAGLAAHEVLTNMQFAYADDLVEIGFRVLEETDLIEPSEVTDPENVKTDDSE